MKKPSGIFVLIILCLLFLSPIASEASVSASQNTLNIQFNVIGEGQALLTNNPTHNSLYVGKLVIPAGASQGSGSMVLYPYGEILNSLTSFQFYISYTTAHPRFIILLDADGDGNADVTLLSDYQSVGNGDWQLSEGGQSWGWTNSSSTMDNYGLVWDNLDYWKAIYGDAKVLFVGVTLEYWAVADSNGLGSPLYADEAIINGITYNIANKIVVVEDWPMYRHDLQGTANSQSEAINGQLLWKFYAGSSGLNRLRSSPIIADGVLYMGTENNRFYALNASTGSQIWYIDVGAPMDSSAAVKDDVVYFGVTWNGHNGYVNALNATDGKIIWQFPTDSGIESSPTIDNGVVYIGSYQGYVYALNASNGALKWAYLTGAEVYCSPSIVDSTLYVSSLDGYVYALNTENGSLIWSSHIGNKVYSSPAVVNSVVYVCTDSGYACALRAKDGGVIWQAFIGSGNDHEDASPAVANGIVYFGARNGFYAFNATTGKQIWFFTSPYSTRQTTGYFYSSPAVASNVVYCGSVDSYLFALSANDGSVIWSYQTGGFLFSSPTIANGVVYIGSYDGNIYALGNPNSQTPQSLPTPSPTTISENQTQTSVPTATPAPSNASQPTATPNPNSTQTPNLTQTQDKTTTQRSETQSIPNPVLSSESNSDSINWIILCVVIVMALLAIIAQFMFFRTKD